MSKIGIITFHNSYNCGSMLESYAMQTIIEKLGLDAEIINFSNESQRRLYGITYKNNTLKNIVKNVFILPAHKRIANNNEKYEEFKNKYFHLTKDYNNMNQLKDDDYSTVVAGSDQIWNITIADSDDAYFLPWVKNAKKVAYAPSFGAKRIADNTKDIEKYNDFLNSFDALSIREKNGQKWIKEMINKDVPVLLDPTVLLEAEDYEKLVAKDVKVTDDKYIFFYSPDFKSDVCKYVKQVADKYNLKVITWSTKHYYAKGIGRFGFELPEYENPAMYLYLLKHAELVMTTSYHGTIFSTLYKKNFITIKNSGMYGNDDRVITLLNQLNMMDRLIPHEFDENFDYLADVNYAEYDKNLPKLKEKSIAYLEENLGGKYLEKRK